MPARPLIDIKTLIGDRPVLTPILRREETTKRTDADDDEKDQPFMPPPALDTSSPSSSTQRAMTMPPETTATADTRPVSDIDEGVMHAIRLVNSGVEKKKPGPIKPPLTVPVPASRAKDSAADRIIPTPIRQRQPPSSFAVVSRPALHASAAHIPHSSTVAAVSPPPASKFPTAPPPVMASRQRSSPLVNAAPSSDKSDAKSMASSSSRSSRIPIVPLIHSIPDSPSVKGDQKASQPAIKLRTASVGPPEMRSRPQSSAMVSHTTTTTPSLARNCVSSYGPPLQPAVPQRPFVSSSTGRGESPAPSSTGESSSGGAPFTPRDGSEIGIRLREGGGDSRSAVKVHRDGRRPSVTFEDPPTKTRERAKSEASQEERRKERRRTEAKAAIEVCVLFVNQGTIELTGVKFGKLVNGRGPLRDDADDDWNRHGAARMSMDGGMMQPGWGAMGMGVASDPALFAAHQRAMMIAKHTYQMAVAQHAMAVAGEEWERSSSIGFGSSGSVYGGSGASAYGGNGPTAVPVMGMGMFMTPGQWGGGGGGGPVMFPSTASMYGGPIGSSQSEYGGTNNTWTMRNTQGGGDTFDPSSSSIRTSYMSTRSGVPSGGQASATRGTTTPRPRAQTGATPPSSSPSSKTTGRSRVPPPSSWKNVR